jgi:hypothetical protein
MLNTSPNTIGAVLSLLVSSCYFGVGTSIPSASASVLFWIGSFSLCSLSTITRLRVFLSLVVIVSTSPSNTL